MLMIIQQECHADDYPLDWWPPGTGYVQTSKIQSSAEHRENLSIKIPMGCQVTLLKGIKLLIIVATQIV